jgi:hypothetical protein
LICATVSSGRVCMGRGFERRLLTGFLYRTVSPTSSLRLSGLRSRIQGIRDSTCLLRRLLLRLMI